RIQSRYRLKVPQYGGFRGLREAVIVNKHLFRQRYQFWEESLRDWVHSIRSFLCYGNSDRHYG
ncbi:MAG: hypothetical protein WA902_09675, partial [Thermosynechococcaceae cyanobacterium]